MHVIDISDAQTSLSSLIAKVEQGQRIIITKAGNPVAMLVPYHADLSPRTLGGT